MHSHMGSCNYQTFARILPYQMLGEVSMHDEQVCMAGQLSAKETPMDARTYKLIELVGVSNESYSEATKNAIARASETLRGLGWFEVTELRGLIQNGEISEYQVTLKVGFRGRRGRTPSVACLVLSPAIAQAAGWRRLLLQRVWRMMMFMAWRPVTGSLPLSRAVR